MCRVPPVSPHGGAPGDRARNRKDLKKDEEEAAERGNEAQGEGEEDAAGGCTQENVVAEKEHLVGVVVAWSDGGIVVSSHCDCGHAHLSFWIKD